MAADPANALVWRHSPRRLDSAELRDAMIAAAGTLSPARLNASPIRELKMVEIRDNGPEARTILEKADAARERSIYLPLMRGITPRPLDAFDPVDQTLVTGMRQVTTVPSQALYLLNSPFVRTAGPGAGRASPRAEGGRRRPHPDPLSPGAGAFTQIRRRRAQQGVPG